VAERELAILVRANGTAAASRNIGTVGKAFGGLEQAGRKAASNLTKNLTRIGVAAVVGIGSQVVLGVKSLAELDTLMRQTEGTIKSTGGAAGVTAGEIRTMAESLENLTTVDDKVIQGGQNMLLTFTGIGREVFPDATKAMVDMAVAMAKGDAGAVDLQGTAIQLGKALNDPVKGMTALRKVGVAFTTQQEDQIKALVKSGKTVEAQRLILRELGVEFGEAGRAAGTGFAADMRRLDDAAEDARKALAIGLMPVLQRAATWLRTKLADPAVLAKIKEFGDEMAGAFSEALVFIEKIDWKAIGTGLSTARDVAKTIVDTFLSLPPWVQTAVVTGWGLNKLTGGAVVSLVGELGKGLIKGVLGMTAGVVNINAASVTGAGVGVAGAAAGGRGLLGTALKVTVVGAVAIAGLEILSNLAAEAAATGVIDESKRPSGRRWAGGQTWGAIEDNTAETTRAIHATHQESLDAENRHAAAYGAKLDALFGAVTGLPERLMGFDPARLKGVGDPRLLTSSGAILATTKLTVDDPQALKTLRSAITVIDRTGTSSDAKLDLIDKSISGLLTDAVKKGDTAAVAELQAMQDDMKTLRASNAKGLQLIARATAAKPPINVNVTISTKTIVNSRTLAESLTRLHLAKGGSNDNPDFL
jgi:hypothetical protein